jgi:hypothetical protein
MRVLIIFGLWFACVLVNLTLWGSIAYLVFHFAQKYW